MDARNVRNVVLMRPIKSMIEFKQIVGRGIRLFEGKDYFTIYDFVRAHEHFSDPEWDGDPLPPDPCPNCGQIPCACAVNPPGPCTVCGERPCICEVDSPGPEPCPECGQRPCVCGKRRKVRVKLADGKERTIQHIAATTFWGRDGKPLSAAQFVEQLFGDLPELFRDEDELRALWGRRDTRKKLLDGLAEKGYGPEQLHEIGGMIEAENSDLYDVLAYIAFALPPVTRAERVASRRPDIVKGYEYPQQEFLNFVLGHYVERGVGELDLEKLPQLLELKYQTLPDAVAQLGRPDNIREVFVGFQERLYWR